MSFLLSPAAAYITGTTIDVDGASSKVSLFCLDKSLIGVQTSGNKIVWMFPYIFFCLLDRYMTL